MVGRKIRQHIMTSPRSRGSIAFQFVDRDIKVSNERGIDLTDYSLLPNGLVFVQNTYSSFLRTTTEYNFVIGSKINKKQFRVGEYWNITFICTKHAEIR